MSTAGGWKVGDSRTIDHVFTLDELTAFAQLTGDYNPLHLNAEYAEVTPAGGRVVHGMLAVSFVSTLIGMHIPGDGALWNSFSVEWSKIIRVGDALSLHAEVESVQVASNTLGLRITATSLENKALYFRAKASVMVLEKTEEREKSMTNNSFILVTGASGSVGGAVCRTLVRQGFKVIAWGRNLLKLKKLQAEIGMDFCHCEVVDLLDSDAVTEKVNALAQSLPVGGFVHAAAATMNFISVEEPENTTELLTHFQIEVMAFQLIASSLVKVMPHGGSVVAVLTQAVFDQPPQKLSGYVAAKTACWGLVKSYATEWGPRGVRFNAVSPNMMNTPFTADMPIRAKQVEVATNPMRRLCLPDDVAEMVGFLMQEHAGYINGANIPITGGSRMPI